MYPVIPFQNSRNKQILSCTAMTSEKLATPNVDQYFNDVICCIDYTHTMPYWLDYTVLYSSKILDYILFIFLYSLL